MNLTLSSRFNPDQSFSSKRTSHSKRGIKVTLSKQKQTPQKHTFNNRSSILSPEKPNQHNLTAPNALFISKDQPSIQNINAQENQLNMQNPTCLKSPQKLQPPIKSPSKTQNSNLIAIYFQKSQQKEQAKKQSNQLDQQIKKLQLQIYNTRTKITQTKYIAQKQQHLISTIPHPKSFNRYDSNQTIDPNQHKSHPNQHNSPNNQKLYPNIFTENINTFEKSHSLVKRRKDSNTKKQTYYTQKSKQIQSSKLSRSQLSPHPPLQKQTILPSKQKQIKNSIIQNNLQQQNQFRSQIQTERNNKSKDIFNQKGQKNKKQNSKLQTNFFSKSKKQSKTMKNEQSNKQSKIQKKLFKAESKQLDLKQIKSSKKRSVSAILNEQVDSIDRKYMKTTKERQKSLFSINKKRQRISDFESIQRKSLKNRTQNHICSVYLKTKEKFQKKKMAKSAFMDKFPTKQTSSQKKK